MMVRLRPFLIVALVSLLTFSGARAEEKYDIYSYGSDVQTPGHPIVFNYGASAPAGDAVTVRVYRISQRTYLDVMRGHTSLQESLVRGLEEVARTSGGLGTKDDSWSRRLVLKPLPVGVYAAVARVDNASTISTLDVTSVGVAQARSYYGRGDTYFFPVDLRTYDRYLGSVNAQIVSDAGSQDLTIEHGLAHASVGSDANPAFVAHAADGSFSAARVEVEESSSAAETGFIQMDRPVYRPGDTMALRAIVRRGTIGNYTVPAGTLHVRVQAPDGTDMFDHDRPLTAFGTVSASIRIPEDAQTGEYSVTVGSGITKSVIVAAYKKPEYELNFNNAPEHVVGGTTVPFSVNARYFFGRPAAGMHLHYTVYQQPHYYDWWFGPYGGLVKTIGVWGGSDRTELASGDVVSDETGRGAFNVVTKAGKEDDDVSISVDGRDASGRTVTTSSNLLVTAASFQLEVEPDLWFAQAGVASTLHVRSRTYDDERKKPNVRVHLEITGRRWEHDREVTTSTKAFDVTTDDKGDATISWTPDQGGDYLIKATAADEAGRVASGSSYLWVLGGGEESWLAPIEQPMLIAAKTTVAPGGSAKLVVALPKRNRDVIIMTSTDRLLSAQVVRVSGTSTQVSVDAPQDATSLNVVALLPGENGIEQTYATIKITPPARALRVSVTAAKHRYDPGERATFNVRVFDANGKPQRTELGLGVVDESIYAVQKEDETNPLDALYSGYAYVYGTASWFRPNRGVADGIGGLAQDEATVAREPAPVMKAAIPNPQPGGNGPAIRSNFLDTAYWSPSVVTDDDGRATISFDWPDNLTTWRATGIGVTVDGDVGKGSGSALVTKDFLVRLETPRFLRAGDRSNIIGIAQGQKADPHVKMQLDAGALASDPPAVSLLLDRFQSATTSWPVTAPGVGSVMLTLSGTDGVRNDAMRLPLPLEAGTAAEHVRDAGSIASRSSFRVTVPPGYLAGAVHLTLSPSLVAELVANQRLLDVYPYYCTEQTMSAALPAVFIGKVLHETHLKPPSDIDIKEIVRHAVARLKQLQHGDGSWGWWENDDGHPFMTAYALYGLAEFRKSGYTVPDSMFDNGVESLVSQLKDTSGDTLAFWGGGQEGSEWNTRAFMLYSLADAAPNKVDRALLEKTRAHVGNLNPYAIAVLGLAEHWLGNDNDARKLLVELDKRATHDGAFIFWRGNTWHYAWEDDPIETTAYALRLEVAMGAPAETTDKVVNFLRAQRQGDWWYTTKDTAAAIYALTEAIHPDSNEFSPDETIAVLVDGHVARTLHVTEPILDAGDASVILPSSLVHAGGTIAFERTGRGSLYWSSDAVRYVPTNAAEASDAGKGLLDRLFAKPPELQLSRSYKLKHSGPWRVGDEVTVDVTVRSRSDVQYVAIEDPFPAGAEHQPEQGRTGDEAWSGIQLLDDRAVFFADRLYANQAITIEYSLRVTTPGHYTAPAPSAYAMYGPPVSALGHPRVVEVVQ